MTQGSLLAISVIALGTYLLRYLPLRASYRSLHTSTHKASTLNRAFEIAGICVIASLFLHSLSLPEGDAPSIAALRLTVSLGAVAVASRAWRNPGVGVLLGIFCFGLLSFLL